MKCKNCNTDLKSDDNYCCTCGAKVINERITSKYLVSDLILSLGWDSQFWLTCRDLLLKPGQVFDKYLGGTRKKYSSPFAFFAIVTTITVLTIGFYTKEMIDITTNINFVQTEKVSDSSPDKTNEENIGQQEKKDQSADRQLFMTEMFTFMFKYYYYISFLLLPLYAFFAFFVFGKPNNFAEHLVINSYIIGITGILGLLLFALTLTTKIREIYYCGQYAVLLIYYPYAYQNYRNYSFKKVLLKILRFFVILFLFVFAIVLLGYLIGFLIKYLTS